MLILVAGVGKLLRELGAVVSERTVPNKKVAVYYGRA